MQKLEEGRYRLFRANLREGLGAGMVSSGSAVSTLTKPPLQSQNNSSKIIRKDYYIYGVCAHTSSAVVYTEGRGQLWDIGSLLHHMSPGD